LQKGEQVDLTEENVTASPRTAGGKSRRRKPPQPSAEELVEREKAERLREKINLRKELLRVNNEARAELEAELAATSFEPLLRETLSEALARPRQEVPHRIDDMHRVGYNSTVSGRFKIGKSTVFGNMLRAFADDVPFLDKFGVLPPEGRTGILNWEMAENDWLDWLTYIDIEHSEEIAPLHLRGRRFSLAAERYQEELVAWCTDMDVEVLIIDPHRRSFNGFGKENDNDDVNHYTDVLDLIKAEANVTDLFLGVHMGRAESDQGAEHARGATALDDWADMRWVMTRLNGDRFLYAEGRMPYVPEFKLAFDPETLRMSAATGNRRTQEQERIYQQAVMVVQQAGSEGLSTTDVNKAMGRTRADGRPKDGKVGAALAEAERVGLLRSEPMKPNGARWFAK
jgi:hypothetical protein